MRTNPPTVNPGLVADHVMAMLAELERRWPTGLSRLRQHSVSVLAGWPEVIVRWVPESAADAECTVAGAYLAGEDPPIVAVAESESRGRQAFTALHELGHHIQQTTDSLIDVLTDQPDDGHALEEAACNSFAADILIPDPLVRLHIGDAGPTAHAIVSLWQDPAVSASRAAVCVRAAQRLRSAGHVLLLDPTGKVTFGESNGLPPVRRGADQSAIPVVAQTFADPSRAHTGRTAIAYRDHITGTDLFAQAKPIGSGFVVLVAVTDHAPWDVGEFQLPAVDTGPRAQWWTCENCEHEFPAFGERCTRCGAPECPECGLCACPPQRERLCMECYLKLPLAMFDLTSDRCREHN